VELAGSGEGDKSSMLQQPRRAYDKVVDFV